VQVPTRWSRPAVNGIANLVERDVVNFQGGSSQRRLT
jgi:hypothetical protein